MNDKLLPDIHLRVLIPGQWKGHAGQFPCPGGTARPWLSGLLIGGLIMAGSAGCDDRSKTEQDSMQRQADSAFLDALDDPDPADSRLAAAPARQRGLADLDFGEDWSPPPRSGAAQPAAGRTSTQPVDASGYSTGPRVTWGIVLHSFTGENHREAAATMISQLSAIDPMLNRGTYTHEREAGSLVVFGRYQSPQAPGAQTDLERIRAIQLSNRPVFPRAMFTRIEMPLDFNRLHPHQILQARLQNPLLRDEHPVYSLEVAVWMAEGDTEVAWTQAQQRAQADAARLRAEGLPAYFYHDHAKRVSSVTVGAFDHRAWDPQSNLESAEVRILRRRFPARSVNGDELREPIDRDLVRRPENIGRDELYIVQQPRLVLVPDL